MDDHDPLIDRLQALGHQPVDPATSSRHLSAMASVGGSHRRLWTRLKIGGAFGVGLVVGGTGLASAGALPGPAQDVAQKALSTVGVKVPKSTQGTERFNDPTVCGLDPATQKPFRNHGQYVRTHPDDPAAAQSRCGKPLKADAGADQTPSSKPPENPSDPATGNGKGGNGDDANDNKGNSANNGNGNNKGNGNGKGNGGNGNTKGPDETVEPPKGPSPTSPGNSGNSGKPAPTTKAPTSTTAAPTTFTTGSTTTSTARR